MKARPLILLALLLIPVITSKDTSENSITNTEEAEYDDDRYREFSAADEETNVRGLFPTIFNLAKNAKITATSTCGERGPESFCKLVEHIMGRSPQCDYCDANNKYKRHPIENAIDGTSAWWQSPTLANGFEYEKVNIVLDLRQEYKIAYLVIKSGNSPRPGTWVLEKSLDGINYFPWQYYATTDADCMRHFGLPATTGVPKYASDNEVICTSLYSKREPLEGGEIHASLVNHRPGATQPSKTLLEFTRARFVRLRLIKPITLNADLMVINRKHGRLDASVTRRYFYSLKDISIGGQCICYGHAEKCPSDPVTGQFICDCRHNTYGESCHKCLPLYNQFPWKSGTNFEKNICQQCQCFGHADACEYDEEVHKALKSMTPEGIFKGGGKCVGCKHNTAGINCEVCGDGFYRPAGLSHYRTDACRPCDCNIDGSENLNCVRDESEAGNGKESGDCHCKIGFGGRTCDRCASGFRNYPLCEPCPCDQRGSLNFDVCDGDVCNCKQNVEGQVCGTCKSGTINLDVNNEKGCQNCFCFGLSQECEERNWELGAIRAKSGFNLTDWTNNKNVQAKEENSDVLMYTTNDYKNDQPLHYWRAPKEFSGNLLNAYGGNLKYFVYYVPSQQTEAAQVADIIVEGNGIKLEYHSRQEFFPKENVSVVVKMKEISGWYNSQSRSPVEKIDMMRVLSDVKYILIRAVYKTGQIQSSIYGLTMDIAKKPLLDDSTSPNEAVTSAEAIFGINYNKQLMKSVEVCKCPEFFEGNSCERCIKGYRRVNNILYNGRCEKCDCNGHSDECDPITGQCLNCQHNTAGSRCQECVRGHVGNPLLGGIAGSCSACACPLFENNQSKDCVLPQIANHKSITKNLDEYICTACTEGYTGNKCEFCADGYFGNPLNASSSCQKCQCNQNIDLNDIGNCDKLTGECLKCIGGTSGDKCQVCQDYHYGDALAHTCKPCNCHGSGSVVLGCDAKGICACKENYEGIHCDRCVSGHGDVENSCPSCSCSLEGSTGEECDNQSGQCSCKNGVYGKQCDRCLPSFYNFTNTGCQYCQCNALGSVEDRNCDTVTGVCECKPNVQGSMCQVCEKGYFNITSNIGCQSCDCDLTGSNNEECDIKSGQCSCKNGVTGDKCTMCEPNFYGFTDEGCKECQKCPAVGQVCDSITGDCVCPKNTVGEMCENCAPNSWNYHNLNGCKSCECSPIGSESEECDLELGTCKCKDGFVGKNCDLCKNGYFNFPNCEPCNCNVNGTDPSQCYGNNCECEDSGQCLCKENAMGLKCDECATNAFSLESNNKKGCTDCFCFDRSQECEQADLYWHQIYAEDRAVTFADPSVLYGNKHSVRLLKESPAKYNSYPTDLNPLYWPLARSFLGDRTSSYNGFLRFKVQSDDNRSNISDISPDEYLFRKRPQVMLIGNDRLILEYFPTNITHDNKYKVHLHEDHWLLKSAPQVKLTRTQMMVALQNVQAIYVRATYNYLVMNDVASLKEISIDVAVSRDHIVEGQTPIKAVGVEKCFNCPPGYGGLSCQDPAQGYFRKKSQGYLNEPNDIKLIGHAEVCACHGHSDKCDPETSKCLECSDNTFGDYCEFCKSGYYGIATTATPNSCNKCECPSSDRSFSDTCTSISHGRGYFCNACKRGYNGLYCESCIDGFYGNPQQEGGFCQDCNCHPDGSLSPTCDKEFGQCECRDGITGRDCSMCEERHAFINKECTSCDQGCTKDLMSDIDGLEKDITAKNYTNLKPVPWKRIARIEATTNTISAFIHDIQIDNSSVKLLEPESYLKKCQLLLDDTKFIFERINKSNTVLISNNEEASDYYKKGTEIKSQIHETVAQLRHFSLTGGVKQTEGDVNNIIAQAKEYLDAIRLRGEFVDKRFDSGLNTFNKSEELLKKVYTKKLNESEFENTKTDISALIDMLEGYKNTIWDSARVNSRSVLAKTNTTNDKIAKFKKIISQIEALKGQTEDSLKTSNKKVVEAKEQKLLEMHDGNTELSKNLKDSLVGQRIKVVDIVDGYGNGYRESHSETIKSQDQAKKLEHENIRIKNAFADTKEAVELPVLASTAYKDIVEAVALAKEKTDSAFDEFNGSDETDLLENVKQALDQSKQDKDRTEELSVLWDTEYLPEKNVEVNERLDKLKNMSLKTDGEIKNIRTKFVNMEDQIERLDSHPESLESTKKEVAEIQQKSHEINVEVTALETRLKELGNAAAPEIKDILGKVSTLSDEVASDKTKVEEAEKMHDRNTKKIEEFTNKLALLKERIKEARERASRIKLSVSSNEVGSCVRKYISPAYPSPSNTFNVKYRPTKDIGNSLIMITMTKGRRTQASEFIAIELKDQRITAHWNIGNGKRSVTNTHTVRYIPSSERYIWYNIELKRYGNSVQLRVVQEQSTPGDTIRQISEPVLVSVGEFDGSNDVIFNTIPLETSIGFGFNGDKKLVENTNLSTYQFRGTVGDLVVDGRRVNLWDFSYSSKECDGGVSAPVPITSGYMFSDGFAQVHLATAERANTMLTIEFSAYSKNGLLYFRGNPETGDFVSLELDNGRISFKVNLGNDSYVNVLSKGSSYAEGKSHTIRIVRNNNQVHLQVDSELDRVTEMIPGENVALNVNDDDHFIGGIPSDLDITAFSKYNINWKGFFGCIKTVKPNQISDLDLENVVRSHRKKPGCTFRNNKLQPNDRTIGFEKSGYLVTNGIQFSFNSSIALNFKTKDESGVILYQSSALNVKRIKKRDASDYNGFISIYLFSGRVVLHTGFDAQVRSKTLTLKSKTPYNDGYSHSIFVSRNEDKVYLRIDDKEVLEGSLNSDKTIGFESNQIYIGGLPTDVKVPQEELPLINGMIGCISDIYYNLELLPIIPDSLSATIGSCPVLKEQILTKEDEMFANPMNAPDSERKSSKLDFANVDPHTEYHVEKTDENIARLEEDDYDSDAHKLPTDSDEEIEEAIRQPVTKNVCGTFEESSSNQATRFGITSSSHSRINFDEEHIPDLNNFKIKFEFKTTEKNGMIWAWANYKAYSRYFYLNIINGRVQLEVRGHKDPKIINIPKVKCNDNKWHSVEMTKRDKIMYLTLDGNNKYFISNCPTPKVMKHRMYVGGVISKHKRIFNITVPGFNGCLREFQVNDKAYDLRKAEFSRDVIPCSHTNSASYIQGYAKISKTSQYYDQTKTTAKYSFSFKTVSANVTLLSIINPNNPSKERISIMLKNGKLFFDLMLKPFHLVENISLKNNLCNGEWHSLSVEFTKEETIIDFDNFNSIHQTAVPVEAIEMLKTYEIYVGGLNPDIQNQIPEYANARSVDGCMKNLEIGSSSIEFHQIQKLNKVILNGCPFV
uniref:Laminin subunit alpha-2 n=1 Tax=Rhabditophanes sp. KR3021 TaxID=114890 RepID=A0AC35TJJ8_9BILA